MTLEIGQKLVNGICVGQEEEDFFLSLAFPQDLWVV